jgi:hypothetical protein
VDGVGASAESSAESVADVGATDLAAAEAAAEADLAAADLATAGVKPKRIENRVRMVDAGSPRQDTLPYISRISPVYLPYISRISPVYLPCISPISPLHSGSPR